MRPRPWTIYLGSGVLLIAVYFALPKGGTAQSTLYDVIGVVSSIGIAAGAALNRTDAPLPWLLFALGNLLFALGDIVFNALNAPAIPSAADALYLAGYPLLVAGLLILLVRSGNYHRLAAIGEAAIVTVAFALFQWVFVMAQLVHGGGSTAHRAVAAAYPGMDVILLAGLAGFFVGAAWRTPAFRLLVASIGCLLVADEIFALGTYSNGDWIDALWLLSYVLWATAALHPSMRELSQPRGPRRRRVSNWRIALLTAALLTAPTLLLVQWARGAPLEVPAMFIAGAFITVLVVLRLSGILRALERLRVEEFHARAVAVAAQRELEAKNEQLLEADRLKDEFVALISHDLRTPLTSIMGYVELSLDDEDAEVPLDPERRGYLEVVARSSERLVRLVDDLLFVARLQAGRLVLEPVDLDLAAVSAQAVSDAQPRAERAGLTLAFEGNGPALVQADKGRIFQLLDNLISNAIKFTPRGGRVDVCVSATDDGSAVEVRDTGIGLGEGETERVFERFFRSDRAVEQQVPGTGLGLFIARAIVEAHQGRISAARRDGRGTTFRVELPARAQEPVA